MQKKIEKIKANPAGVKKLNLLFNYSLKAVPKEIKDCINLETLDLSCTHITSIPDFVFQFPKLKNFNYQWKDQSIGR